MADATTTACGWRALPCCQHSLSATHLSNTPPLNHPTQPSTAWHSTGCPSTAQPSTAWHRKPCYSEHIVLIRQHRGRTLHQQRLSLLTCEGLTCRCILRPLASRAGTRAAVGCVWHTQVMWSGTTWFTAASTAMATSKPLSCREGLPTSRTERTPGWGWGPCCSNKPGAERPGVDVDLEIQLGATLH